MGTGNAIALVICENTGSPGAPRIPKLRRRPATASDGASRAPETNPQPRRHHHAPAPHRFQPTRPSRSDRPTIPISVPASPTPESPKKPTQQPHRRVHPVTAAHKTRLSTARPRHPAALTSSRTGRPASPPCRPAGRFRPLRPGSARG